MNGICKGDLISSADDAQDFVPIFEALRLVLMLGWTRFLKCSACEYVQEAVSNDQAGIPCPHHAEYGCAGQMELLKRGFKWLGKTRQVSEEATTGSCVCKHPAATLKVCTMSGEIVVGSSWTVSDAKMRLANKIKIPAREQCWVMDQMLLQDSSLIVKLAQTDGSPPISLARRDPEVAEWMERIASDWSCVQTAANIPGKIWKSSHQLFA